MMDIHASSKSAIRVNFGVKSITVRGETIHPECRTDEELMTTVAFSKEAIGCCDRCGVPLEEIPV